MTELKLGDLCIIYSYSIKYSGLQHTIIRNEHKAKIVGRTRSSYLLEDLENMKHYVRNRSQIQLILIPTKFIII